MNLLTIATLEKLLAGYNKENANLTTSTVTSEKEILGAINRTFALEYDLPKDAAKAHKEGLIHFHDLDFYTTRSNCANHPIEMILIEGLDALTCTSKPAKHFQSAINHILKALGAMQAELAGGQGIPLFNVFLAPYVRGATYAEVYQGVQHFIYECNQINATRGMQSIFSNINCEFSIPDFMQNEIVKYSQNKGCTFAEFEDEARLILKAICEVLLNRDREGRPFAFPNFITVIRKNLDKDDELFQKVIEVNMKVNNAYYVNMVRSNLDLIASMGCRTRLSSDHTGNWRKDVLGTGNFEYVTINLPRLAIENKLHGTAIETVMDKAIKLAVKGLFTRRERILTLYDNNQYKFMKKYHSDEYGYYYNYDKTTMSLGFTGLAEFLTLMNADAKYGQEVIGMLRNKIDNMNKTPYADYARILGVKYTDRDEKPRWSLIGSPAESCSARMKKLDDQLFPKIMREAKLYGKKYYTNSFHVPETSDMTALDKIHAEEPYHTLCNAGAITHIWNPEVDSDYASVAKFTYNMLKSSDVSYCTYSPTLIYCKKCKSLFPGDANTTECNCGSTGLTMFAKITGYLAEVTNWNEGKTEEFQNRNKFNLK